MSEAKKITLDKLKEIVLEKCTDDVAKVFIRLFKDLEMLCERYSDDMVEKAMEIVLNDIFEDDDTTAKVMNSFGFEAIGGKEEA